MRVRCANCRHASRRSGCRTSPRFVMSQMYASWGQGGGPGLNAEAIDLIDGLVDSSPEPAIERALGDRYLTIGLTRLAEQSYVNAAQPFGGRERYRRPGNCRRRTGHGVQ